MRNFNNNISAISSTSVAPVRTRNATYIPPGEMKSIITKEGAKQASTVTMSTNIKAPVEACFDLVLQQFKEAPRWDPIVRWVIPISNGDMQVGSKSRFVFDLAGSIEDSVVVLRSLIPNKAIVWTSDHRTGLQEEWHFGKQADGTTSVAVTLSFNPPGGLMKYFVRRTRIHTQVEQAVSEMLRRLKLAAELPKPRYL